MNLDTKSGKIYISFNQTEEYACFGTPIGFYIYCLNPFKKILSRKIDGGVSIVKMLYNSNIIIFTGRSKKSLYPNNKLIVWDDSKKSVLGEIQYNTPILNIYVTKYYIVVLIDKKIYVYNFESLNVVKSINVNTNGPNKLFCIGLEKSNNLIYTGDKPGTINVTKLDKDHLDIIQAHNSNIEHLYLSNNGKYIISASERGTIIRLFSTETLEKINEFRRGSETVKIIDIKMDRKNSMILISSAKGTIHVYNSGINDKLTINNPSFDNYGVPYIKWALPQYFSDKWSFSQFNFENVISYSVFDTKNKFRIFSFGDNGQFYELNFSETDNPVIDKAIKYISDENDPFSERTTTIK
jgi:WD repeat-containing protein 45